MHSQTMKMRTATVWMHHNYLFDLEEKEKEFFFCLDDFQVFDFVYDNANDNK
jgi:hypothetical protein